MRWITNFPRKKKRKRVLPMQLTSIFSFSFFIFEHAPQWKILEFDIYDIAQY